MKVVAFNGSARKDGNTAVLVRRVFAELEAEGIETELVQLYNKGFRGCTACLKCAETQDSTCPGLPDDGMNACIARMVEADGIIIASPTYYANCTATTQALLERAGYATRKSGNPLARKVGAAVVAVRRGGAIHAFDSINHWFQINEMLVVGLELLEPGHRPRQGRRRERRRGHRDDGDARPQHGLGAQEAQRLNLRVAVRPPRERSALRRAGFGALSPAR